MFNTNGYYVPKIMRFSMANVNAGQDPVVGHFHFFGGLTSRVCHAILYLC
jgi:hypothetical protein